MKINWPTLFSKTKRIVQEHNVLPCSFLSPLYIYIYIYRIKKNLECNAMQLLETEEKNTKTKEQWLQRKSNEAQGPCQKDSVSLSLLHPKLFRCTMSIGVYIHNRVISNSKIGIKVECLYQFTNKCYRILCLFKKR